MYIPPLFYFKNIEFFVVHQSYVCYNNIRIYLKFKCVSLSEVIKQQKGVVLMRKSEKNLYSIIRHLLIVIFILLTIIIFK